MNRRLCAMLLVIFLLPQVLLAASFNPDQEAKTADKGPYPWEYGALVQQFISDVFFDPSSVLDFEMTKPTASWWRGPGLGRVRERTTFCWMVMFTANAKNRMGGYVGKKAYVVYIRDARIVSNEEILWNPRTESTFNRFKSQGENNFRAEWEKLTPELQQKAQLLMGSSQPKPDKQEPSYIEELKALAVLREQGVITEEEFNAKKRQLLGLDTPEAEKPHGDTSRMYSVEMVPVEKGSE